MRYPFTVVSFFFLSLFKPFRYCFAVVCLTTVVFSDLNKGIVLFFPREVFFISDCVNKDLRFCRLLMMRNTLFKRDWKNTLATYFCALPAKQ